jgi:hypothetical protein
VRAPVIERKIKSDGSVREYACELLHAEPNLVVARYRVQGGATASSLPIALPPGSTSDGYFWRRQHYNLYRFTGPDGAVLGHRFDAVIDVRFAPGLVEYRDLVLDWWALPGGTLIEEDRDEFEDQIAAGNLSPTDVAAAEDASRRIFSRYRHIIDGVAAFERLILNARQTQKAPRTL